MHKQSNREALLEIAFVIAGGVCVMLGAAIALGLLFWVIFDILLR